MKVPSKHDNPHRPIPNRTGSRNSKTCTRTPPQRNPDRHPRFPLRRSSDPEFDDSPQHKNTIRTCLPHRQLCHPSRYSNTQTRWKLAHDRSKSQYKRQSRIHRRHGLYHIDNRTYRLQRLRNIFTAMSVFALMAFGKYEDDEAETIKKQLLVYCKQDTLAMVKQHERLVEYV